MWQMIPLISIGRVADVLQRLEILFPLAEQTMNNIFVYGPGEEECSARR